MVLGQRVQEVGILKVNICVLVAIGKIHYLTIIEVAFLLLLAVVVVLAGQCLRCHRTIL